MELGQNPDLDDISAGQLDALRKDLLARAKHLVLDDEFVEMVMYMVSPRMREAAVAAFRLGTESASS